MFSQYLKLAFRSFRNRPGYTFIHIFGLATGMAACLLLLQYISFELSYDRFHSKAEHIYRVVNERFQNGEHIQKGTITYPTIGAALQKDYPEVKNASRYFFGGEELIKTKNGETYRAERCYYTDPQFLEIFDFPLLATAKDSLLALPLQVIVTEKHARKWFNIIGDDFQAILGEQLEVDGSPDLFTIVGVMKNTPANSHLSIDLLLSYATVIRAFGTDADKSWTWSDFHHYIELAPETDVDAFQEKLTDFSARHFRGAEVSGAEEVFYLQPLLDVHLNSSDFEYENAQTANGKSIWALLLIAFFILLIAWINYANLTASRAIERAQEVGLRKVVGASNRQLISQFFTEAIIANVISFGCAILLVQLMQPLALHQLQIDLDGGMAIGALLVQHPRLLLTAGGLCLLGLALSALYPSWVLSNQQMATVVKGNFKGKGRGRNLHQGLIIFQFTISIGLIAGTLLVYRQINFLQEKDIGLNIEQIMVVRPPELSDWDSTFIDRMDVFKAALRQLPQVQSACTAYRVPGDGIGRTFDLTRPAAENKRNHTFGFIQVDHDYAETYELVPVAGRDFEPGDHSLNFDEINTVMINEKGVQALGLGPVTEAIGQVVNTFGKDWTIIGVVPDFHQQSLHHPIEPLLLQPFYGTANSIAIRLSQERLPETIEGVRQLFDSHFPGNIFSYSFLDEQFAMQYASDRKFGQILLFFTILTILIACLGLIGLVSYSAQLRTKEISIRKILGAGTAQLVFLLSGDFLKLVVVAIIVGLPIAWWGIQFWLQNYAYQASFAWWSFPLAAISGLAIAFLTVSYYSLHAAWANPAEQLRGE